MKNAEIYDAIAEQVLALMEEHGTDWTKPWTENGVPHNVQGHPYHGLNVFILGLACYKHGYGSNIWGTIKQWNKAGARVRVGESARDRGQFVVFYKVVEHIDDNGDQSKIPFARVSYVFNEAQVDGWERVVKDGEEWMPLHNCERFVESCDPQIRPNPQALYSPGSDTIGMPAKQSFVDAYAYYATMFHELGHWSGAKHRLNRDLTGYFGTEAYAIEELVAELTSAFLCTTTGIASRPRADHAKYLNAWKEKIREESYCFVRAAREARNAADYLEGLQ